MPNSAQRSVRISRTDLVMKAAPSATKAVPSTTTIEDQAELPTVSSLTEGAKVQGSPNQQGSIPLSPLEAQQQQQPSEQETASTEQQQPRSKRARKPSSRLLPSPSPPPSRSSHTHQHHSHSASKAASLTTIAASAPKNMQKKQQAATPTLLVLNEAISNTETASQSPGDEKEFGPGKRKRRPSTMSKPPSTITKQTLPTTALQGSVVPAPLSNTTLKVRLNRVASKSQSPEEKSQTTKGPRKSKEQNVEGPLLSTAADYDSDGNAHDSSILAMAEPDGDADHEEDSDAGPSKAPVARKVGHVRIKVHPLSAAREKFGGRRWPTCSGGTLLEPPPLISRRGGLKAAHQGSVHASQRPVKSESNHLRSQSTSVLDGRWAWNPSSLAPTLRFRLSGHAGDEEFSEASDLDDEDDFHVAMLDGSVDFEDAHHGKAASLSSKSSHRDSKSGDDSEGEDTPATTPRSPQSTCDLPERRWSTGADDEEKETCKATKDAVFAHALEPSSRRPHTHAGSLTLSLPFDEMTQGGEEDAATSNLKRRVAQAESVKEEEDSSSTSGLMSPAVHHTILGLSSKQHALLLSSPQTASSAFTSPALDPSGHDVKVEPLPLSLPPPASLLRARDALNKKQGKGKHHIDQSEMPASALHSDEEAAADDEVYGHAASASDLPERMCLSELDRAWEQSEYLEKARRMADDPEDEARKEEDDASNTAVEADLKEDHSESRERSTRGSKRLSLAVSKEEQVETKRPKPSPKSKAVPSPGRRSARHAGIKA